MLKEKQLSPRIPLGNEQGLIATPLYWEEVNDKLRPTLFPMPIISERIKNQGDPFKNFRQIGEEQKFEVVLDQLRDLVENRTNKKGSFNSPRIILNFRLR